MTKRRVPSEMNVLRLETGEVEIFGSVSPVMWDKFLAAHKAVALPDEYQNVFVEKIRSCYFDAGGETVFVIAHIDLEPYMYRDSNGWKKISCTPDEFKGQVPKFWRGCETVNTSKENPEDNINKPSHYTKGQIEPFDLIRAQKLDFAEGSVVKYIVRYKHKGKPLEDLKKARWYLDRLIEKEETKK